MNGCIFKSLHFGDPGKLHFLEYTRKPIEGKSHSQCEQRSNGRQSKSEDVRCVSPFSVDRNVANTERFFCSFPFGFVSPNHLHVVLENYFLHKLDRISIEE